MCEEKKVENQGVGGEKENRPQQRKRMVRNWETYKKQRKKAEEGEGELGQPGVVSGKLGRTAGTCGGITNRKWQNKRKREQKFLKSRQVVEKGSERNAKIKPK